MGYPVRQKLPTETAEITVAYVNERQEGQFSASIKDTDKNLFWVSEKDLPNFKVGERYEIEFSVSQSKNGFVNRKVEVIRHLTPHGHQPSESNEERAAAKVSDVARSVQQLAKPQPVPASRKDPTPLRIFVCGGLNTAISSHQVNVHDEDDIVAVTENLMRAWARTLGAES
jgi:hypothetical protein